MRHVIKKQVIDLRIRNKKDAYRVQQLASEQYHKNVITVLQKAFDKVYGDGEVVRIDRLEIDLGVLTEKEIEKGIWETMIFKILTEQLDRLKHGKFSEAVIKRQSPAAGFADQWLFYMQKGYLPWNAAQIDDGWHEKVLYGLATDFTLVTRLRSLIGTDESSVKRIVFQHKENFLVALTESLTAQSQKLLPSAIDEIIQLILFLRRTGTPQKVTKASLRHRLWQQVLTYGANQREKKTSEALIVHLLESNLAEIDSPARMPRRFFAANRITAQVLLQWKERTKAKGKQVRGQVKENVVRKKRTQSDPEDIFLPIDQPAETTKKTYRAIATNDVDSISPQTVDEQTIYSIGGEEIFAQYAGIVLLHPFLKAFFNNLNLLEGNAFISSDHHQKALYLVYYLATGLVTPAEHELVSAKIICAYPLHMPVPGKFELLPAEIKEADDLLMEVIRQWEVLKDSSPGGLREGFLQRSGKFFSNNDNLYLQVETESIDVLLDYLPWNLNIVQLPWMNTMLKVEWR